MNFMNRTFKKSLEKTTKFFKLYQSNKWFTTGYSFRRFQAIIRGTKKFIWTDANRQLKGC